MLQTCIIWYGSLHWALGAGARGARKARATGVLGARQRRWRAARGVEAGVRGARAQVAGAQGTAGWAVWACYWASRLYTLCTQPVLTQFRLSTIPESIFGHCS